MGLIAKLLSFSRRTNVNAKISETIVNPGGGANLTCEHYADAGDDSYPLPGDYVATTQTPRTGGQAAVGYLDPKNTPKAGPGEKRIYARDSAGNTIVELWLKNNGDAVLLNETASFEVNIDGSIKGSNGSGSFELAASGDFIVNGVTIDTGGNITTAAMISSGDANISGSLMAGGKQLINHTHPNGTPNTGVNN